MTTPCTAQDTDSNAKTAREDEESKFNQVLNDLHRTRLKFLVRVAFIGTASYSWSAFINLQIGHIVLDLVALSLYLLSGYFCRFPHQLNLARGLFFSALSTTMFIGPLLSGHFESQAAWLYGIIPLCAVHLYGPKRVFPSTIATLVGLYFHYDIGPRLGVPQELVVDETMQMSLVFAGIIFFSAIAISSARMLERQGAQLREASAELIHSQAAVDADSHSKGVFMANMSHEIRTPMNGILGMLEELQQRNQNGTYHALIETAKESGNRLLEALNNILDVSKIEANKLSLVEASFRPDLVLCRLEQEFGPVAKRRGLSLAFHRSSDWPAVIGDQARLYQILAVLVDNAIRYSDQGCIQVHARYSKLAAQELCQIEFEVIDQGPGISASAQSRIFSGFETKDDLSDQRSGIGLGLALARNLALLMNGDIQLRSELGQGSTFTATVSLPISTSAPDLAHHPDLSLARFDLNILLVDDDPINRRVTSLQFKRLGCEVHQASSGRAAITMANARSFDLVFMDLQMPDMSGYEAAKKILEHCTSNPRIIAFSSDADPQSLERARQAGMVDYVVKPIPTRDLQQVLSRHQGPRAAPLLRCG